MLGDMNNHALRLQDPPFVRVCGRMPVTREMVYQRTHELAVLAGRDSRRIQQADYEQAKRELTGEMDSDRQQAVLDAPCPVDSGLGSSVEQARETPLEEEDDEGRSLTKQIFEGGAKQAEWDKMRAAARNDRS